MIMSPEVSRPTKYWIDVWFRTVVLAFALVAAPHLSAQVIQEPDDQGDDVRDDGRTIKTTSGEEARPNGGTVLSMPLTGTGVEVKPNHSPASKPMNQTAKLGTTASSNKDTELFRASASAPKTKERTDSNGK
jgi:hypothetical protein